MILDIGCGSRPRGHVNTDRFFNKNPHHQHNYDLGSTRNFILSDANNGLPFRDNIFYVVHSSHVLEHLIRPLDSLQEFKRVSRKYVIITVPNNPTVQEFNRHLYSWSLVSLKNFMQLVFNDVLVYANSPMSDLLKSRIFKRVLGIKYIKKPIQRLISKWLGLQITGIGVK